MPFHDTRLGPGTLTFGSAPLEVGFQVNACTLTPAPDETDGTPTLAVPEPPPEYKNKYTLDGTAINDFTDPDGFQRYAMEQRRSGGPVCLDSQHGRVYDAGGSHRHRPNASVSHGRHRWRVDYHGLPFPGNRAPGMGWRDGYRRSLR